MFGRMAYDTSNREVNGPCIFGFHLCVPQVLWLDPGEKQAAGSDGLLF